MSQRDWKADLELCQKAYPGPWKYDGIDFVLAGDGSGPVMEVRGAGRMDFPQMDAAGYMAAEAREGWPAALTELLRLQEENVRLSEAAFRLYQTSENHWHGCGAYCSSPDDEQCTCGLTEARKAYRALQPLPAPEGG